MNNFFERILNFAAPRFCLICGKIISDEKSENPYICSSCSDSFIFAPDSKAILSKLWDFFGNDKTYINIANSLISAKENDEFMQVIYSLKYSGLRNVGYIMGKQLGHLLIKEKNTKYDFIHPIPIHKVRMRERGFNQSYYIALGVAEIIKVKILTKNLFRTEYTQTQTVLNHSERALNMQNKFATNFSLNNKRILLIDDVITTGATINNCARAAVLAGADFIGAASIVLA